MTNQKKQIGIVVFILILVNIIAMQFHTRWDMTSNQRYSISKPTQSLLQNISKPIHITVYLKGNLPFDFEKLSNETAFFLEEIVAKNSRISYTFVNPKGKEDKLIKQGLTPSKLTVQEDGKISESIIFPWAVIGYGQKKSSVNLLKSSSFESQETQIENSVQNLEFALASGIQKITTVKKQKIAILKSHGTLKDIYQYDFLKTLGQYYFLAPFTLDSVEVNPQKTLKALKEFDLTIISKPTRAFTEKEKFTLDQYTLYGGKTLWLLDMVNTSKDSLMQHGKVLAYQQNLNLTDYFFNYGIRIKKHLVKDLYAAKIPLAVGKIGNKTQYDEFLWDYYPVIKSNNKHVISKNIGPVKLEFVNSIDTLNPNIQKTPLLESSPLTKTLGMPNYINLASIAENATVKSYQEGSKILGILLEGDFKSAYRNRVKPFDNQFKAQGQHHKMIVIADGDISTNQISKGKPLALGLDKWTNQFYENKEFLTNAVHYLLNEKGLIQLKSKKVVVSTINKPKAYQEKTKWQLINLLFPVLILCAFGVVHYYTRKTKYQKGY